MAMAGAPSDLGRRTGRNPPHRFRAGHALMTPSCAALEPKENGDPRGYTAGDGVFPSNAECPCRFNVRPLNGAFDAVLEV
jgi:hypothetical protein